MNREKQIKDRRVKGRRTPRESGASMKRTLIFTRKNYLLLAIGIGVIVAGYLFLARGSITLAPILLILGYCVIIPVAIIVR